MDLTHTTSQDLGSALSRVGVTWVYDDDGDIRIRFRSGEQPWIDVVFYEFDAAKVDFSMRGQFLNGRAVPQGDGMTRWEVSTADGLQPTAVAQKVVTVYLMPRSGGVGAQIHASIAPLDQPRPMHIKVIPGSEQVSMIERAFPGFLGRGDNKHFWISGGLTGCHVGDAELLDMLRTMFQIGLQMFDGPFAGWLYSTDL